MVLSKLNKKGQGKGFKFLRNLVILTIIGLVIITLFGSISSGSFNVAPTIFILLLGFIIFLLFRLVVVAGPKKDLKFEDFILTAVVVGVILFIFITFPQLVPNSLGAVMQSIADTQVGAVLQAIGGG